MVGYRSSSCVTVLRRLIRIGHRTCRRALASARQSKGVQITLSRSLDRFGDIAADVAEVADRHFLEPFSAFVELFVDLDGCFLHDGMSLLAAADKKEVPSPGEASLPVVIVERQPQDRGRFGTFIGSFHDVVLAESSVG